MDSLICTPEAEDKNTLGIKYSSSENTSPFTPPVLNAGLGLIYDANTSPMMHQLPNSTDAWCSMAQAIDGSLVSSDFHGVEEPFWAQTLQSLQPANMAIQNWQATSMFNHPPISTPSLSTAMDSGHSPQPCVTGMMTDNLHSLLASPSLTPSPRSITPSEPHSMDEFKPLIDYTTQTATPTPRDPVWYQNLNEDPDTVSPLNPVEPLGSNEAFQALLSTVSSPNAPVADHFGTTEGDNTAESRRRSSLPVLLGTIPTSLEDKKRSMEEKVKLTRQRQPKLLGSLEKPICPTCNKDFSRKHNLQQHIERIHKPQAKAHQCQYCTLAFKRAADLLRHFRSVSHWFD
jgi:uncharacterized Zn-finger protein